LRCPAASRSRDGREAGADVLGDVNDKQVVDAGLIAAAQAVEHYEITRYGTLVAWAKQLDLRGPLRFEPLLTQRRSSDD
jgi:ferritin-like metal-binding protein YciE